MSEPLVAMVGCDSGRGGPLGAGCRVSAARTTRLRHSSLIERTNRHWNRTIARLRIHGTTRRQVWTHFVEVEQRALQALAADAFPYFMVGERTVHTDGHVEVAGAFYPVPLALLGQRVRIRWDAHLVRVLQGDTLVMVHARVAAGVFAPRAGEAEAGAIGFSMNVPVRRAGCLAAASATDGSSPGTLAMMAARVTP